MALTRSDREVFLIGLYDTEPLLRLKQLATNRHVLQRFHCYLQETRSVRNASHNVKEEVLGLWATAAIPTMLKTRAIEKLENYMITGYCSRRTKGVFLTLNVNVKLCIVSSWTVNMLFDIAHAKALKLIKIQEDRDFLNDQR